MAVRHDRIQDLVVFHAMTLARQKVINTVGGGRVDDTGTGIHRNVFFRVNRGETPETLVHFVKGMFEADAFQSGAFCSRQNLPVI